MGVTSGGMSRGPPIKGYIRKETVRIRASGWGCRLLDKKVKHRGREVTSP